MPGFSFRARRLRLRKLYVPVGTLRSDAEDLADRYRAPVTAYDVAKEHAYTDTSPLGRRVAAAVEALDQRPHGGGERLLQPGGAAVGVGEREGAPEGGDSIRALGRDDESLPGVQEHVCGRPRRAQRRRVVVGDGAARGRVGQVADHDRQGLDQAVEGGERAGRLRRHRWERRCGERRGWCGRKPRRGDDQGGGGGASLPEQAQQATKFDEGDIGILNYALTLEFLEAEFYQRAAESGMLKGQVLEVAKSFGENEQEHVEALQATIQQMGGKPAEKPKAEFPLESQDKILQTAAEVENLGAAAYLGQAGKIQNKEVLAAALSIHTVEARHAAALNAVIGKSFVPDGAFAKPADMETVLAAVAPFLVK